MRTIMKNKVLLVSLIAVALCYILVANRTYQFRQEFDQITKIEILEKEKPLSGGYDVPMKVLKTLDTSEHRAFIDDFMRVDGSRVGMDPPTDFGTYLIRITYRNGEIELISDSNNGYISVDGIVYTANYCMDDDAFYDFLSGVLGVQVTELTLK